MNPDPTDFASFLGNENIITLSHETIMLSRGTEPCFFFLLWHQCAFVPEQVESGMKYLGKRSLKTVWVYGTIEFILELN